MSITLPVNYENCFCYNIMLEDSFERFYAVLSEFHLSERKVCIITETNVGPHYLAEIKSGLQGICSTVVSYTFPAGESSKTLDTVQDIYEFLIQNHFNRKDLLIALGGGVTGDMTGYIAATYLRGIDFIQLPTSLLSQVDSSIGGKTGVDFKGYKNMVGAFKQPKLVYMNLNTLQTLPEREYLSGMGEVVKHGFIKDEEFLRWIEANVEGILSKDYLTLEHMIRESCKIKRAVVELDPKETLGERAKLNFGHTIGHAIEKYMDFQLLHGECVSIGMVAALLISFAKGYILEKDVKTGITILQKLKLPVFCSGELDINDILQITLSDKKMEQSGIKFILLTKLGDCTIDASVTLDDMRLAVETMMNMMNA